MAIVKMMNWYDVAAAAAAEAREDVAHGGDGEVIIKLYTVARDEETADGGTVHDLYKSEAVYDWYNHDGLELEDVAQVLRNEAIDNEQHDKEYKRESALDARLEKLAGSHVAGCHLAAIIEG